MANIPNFYQGTTVQFFGVITQNGVNPDITSDTVRILLKENKGDADADAKINVTADVTTNGASGRFDVELTPTNTDIAVRTYHMEIVWLTGAREYVPHQQRIACKERVEDVP